MKISPLFFRTVLCAALTLSALPQAQAQFTYTFYPDDAAVSAPIGTDFAIVGYTGGNYNDDFTRNFTSPSSPTVEFGPGADGSAAEMDIFNHSVVNLAGGSFAFIVPFDDSTLNVSGGQSGVALSLDRAVVNVSGGSLDDLEGQGKEVNVSGGAIASLVANTNTDNLGNSLGSCIVNVTGGRITGEADAYNDGILNLFGGQIDADVYARFGGTVNIFGNSLSATLLDPNDRSTFSLYSLSGMLADGTLLTHKNLFIENDGVTYGHSSFNLINTAAVPEPGLATLLLGMSATGAIVRWRGKKRKPILSRKQNDSRRTCLAPRTSVHSVRFCIAVFSLLSIQRNASADATFTFSGNFSSAYDDAYAFDGADFTPLPGLFEGLAGGSFQATYFVPTLIPPADPAVNSANYAFGAPYGLQYKIFDQLGNVVMIGAADPQNNRVGVQNDVPVFTIDGDLVDHLDSVSLTGFGGSLDGVQTPAPLYGTPDFLSEALRSGLRI